MTPTTILLALAMFAYALTWAPGKFKPAWSRQLKPWQALVGLVALIVALFIIMNPEFYALGLLGDSAFLICWCWPSACNCNQSCSGLAAS